MSPERDQRSVGELLMDADAQARQLLLHVDGDDAPALMRTWGEVVQNASDLWAAFPSEPLASPDAGPTMQRLETMSQTLHHAQIRQTWPGPGPSHERLLTISDNLARATELVDRYCGDVRPTTDPVRADLAAARMRVMHTLYVGSHAVGVAVQQHHRDLQDRFGKKGSPRQQFGISRSSRQHAARQAAARRAADHLAAFEQLAGAVTGRRFGEVLAGEHQLPASDTGRLGQAMADLDIQSHRVLAATPTAANLHLSAATQAGLAHAGIVILAAASSTGQLDPSHRARLVPALESSGQAWHRLADQWGDMLAPGDRADPSLRRAAGETRAAVYEVAMDKTSWATAEVITQRVDLAEAAATVQMAVAAAVEAAGVHRDVAVRDQSLTGPARTMAARARELDDGVDRQVPWVKPADLHANRVVALPAPLRQELVAATDRLVDITRKALSASSVLNHAGWPSPAGAESPRRLPEERQHPSSTLLPSRPGPQR
ncbi:hypothetical protein [Segeticoccus rhizosphaerae]|uniref:hypothetical protein n=1 Tax=Segeticoccus rhizosphaerae TaxID=1104777 RepID=UPI001263F6E4|nr:hypothetical protein [Segeticoccus rhizosphaerae]